MPTPPDDHLGKDHPEDPLLGATKELVHEELGDERDTRSRDRMLFARVWPAREPRPRGRRMPRPLIVGGTAVILAGGLAFVLRAAVPPIGPTVLAPSEAAPIDLEGTTGGERTLPLATGGAVVLRGEGRAHVLPPVPAGTLASAPRGLVELEEGTLRLELREADGAWSLQAGPFTLETSAMDGTLTWVRATGHLELWVVGGAGEMRGPLAGSARRLRAGERLVADAFSGRVDVQPAGGVPADVAPAVASPQAGTTAALMAAGPAGRSSDVPADLPAGDAKSHWLQPWRAVRLTQPASRMRQAPGVIVTPFAEDAAVLPPLLARAGFARVSMAIDWPSLAYDHPDQLAQDARDRMRAWIRAFADEGLRPLFVLHGHRSLPTPLQTGSATVMTDAPAGARELKLDRASAARIAPGRTGLDTPGIAASVLFVEAAADGTVRLSRPLPAAVAAGPIRITTLRFAPFQSPKLASGAPNPAFEETIAGWMLYLRTVCREARDILGAAGFDLQIWNDGTTFLDARNYYDPAPPGTSEASSAEILRVVTARAAAWISDPRNGLQGVQLIDALSTTNDLAAPAPPGVHALGRMAIARSRRYPAPDDALDPKPWLDALARPNGGLTAEGRWVETFTPRYDVAFPEILLTALPARDRLFPDLLSLHVHGPHADRARAPLALWLTSFNLNPAATSQALAVPFTEDQSWRFRAKSALRTLSAYVGLGAETVFFYTARHRDVGLVDPRDPERGGEVLRALDRFLAAFQGPEFPAATRTLHLERVTGCETCVEFAGGSAAAFPALAHKDLVTFVPFQIDEHSFITPVYVMTRNLARARKETGVDRFDLPGETFRLTVSGLHGETVTASATDPITEMDVPVRVVARDARSVTLELPLSDAPRLLRLAD